MYVEVLVKGAVGELAASAFPELAVQRREVLVTSEADVFAALDHLMDHELDVVVLRQRTNRSELD
jgi:hypothetical protein